MRNLNFGGESGSEPYSSSAQAVGGVAASDGFYSPEFRGDFGAGLLDLHAMDDTELLSEVWFIFWLWAVYHGLMNISLKSLQYEYNVDNHFITKGLSF